MYRFSKIICFVMLISFSFTTTAAGMLCSLKMTDETESQQSTMDSSIESCHKDTSKSSDNATDDCCQDMNSCSTSVSFVSNVLIQAQVTHSSVRLPTNEPLLSNTTSPPVPPPKLIV